METTTRPDIQYWLQQHCDSTDAVVGGVVILSETGQGTPDMVAEWPGSGTLSTALAGAAQSAVQRDRPVVIAPGGRPANAGHNRVISQPLKSGDRLVGAVALAIKADDSHAVDQMVDHLGKASAGVGAESRPQAASRQLPSLGQVLKFQAVLLCHASLAEGALAMVTELCAAIGAERIMLGVLDPEIEVVAVSHSAEFQPQQSLLRLAAAAMQEATDQGARVNYPADPTEPARIILAHAELQAQSGHALHTVPLVHAGKAVGALLVAFRADETPPAAALLLCDNVACVVAPLVALRRNAERSWHARLALAAAGPWRRLVRRDDPLPKLVLLTLAGLMLAATLIPVTHRVGAQARVEGAVQRVVVAPFDGFLQRSHARPGDVVRAGELLVEMADQDLVLDKRRLESTLSQQENAHAAALARSDRAQFVISHGKAEEARSQLQLVRQQLQRTRLLAPIDGEVIKGDLSQTLGSPVQRGEVLMTLAPRGQYRLIVEVDERDIAEIRPGQRGQLALAGMPSDTLPLVVERVTPVSRVRDGRNVFDVEASLPASALALRPGLQGVAKIDVGEQSFGWIWSHRIVDWLRLAWWSWGS